MSKDRALLSGLKFAHRGLYDNEKNIPENSMSAFRAAMEAGVGVELDVQLTKDGYIVVFHDDTLLRLCGVEGTVRDCTLYELKQLRLLGTEETIPLFTDVLEVLSEGKVPLIVELKTGGHNYELCRKILERLSRYSIPYAVESFDPRIVRWFSKNSPETIRGRLVTDRKDYRRSKGLITSWLLAGARLRSYDKPDFFACNMNMKTPRAAEKFRKKGGLFIGWTSSDPDTDLELYDSVIFEEKNNI